MSNMLRGQKEKALRGKYMGGGPMSGAMYSYKGTPYYRRHFYRCPNRWDNPKVCPVGENLGAYPAASAIIPFIANLLKDKTQLILSLRKAAQTYEHGGAFEEIETETQAELAKTN